MCRHLVVFRDWQKTHVDEQVMALEPNPAAPCFWMAGELRIVFSLLNS